MGIVLSFYYEKARSFIDLCGDPPIGTPTGTTLLKYQTSGRYIFGSFSDSSKLVCVYWRSKKQFQQNYNEVVVEHTLIHLIP